MSKLLLVQIRSDEETRAEEHQTFATRCRLPLKAVRSVNLCVQPPSEMQLRSGEKAVIIGGSSGFSAWDMYPWMPELLRYVQWGYHADVPMFGACWGHQLIARALGGTVIYDGERAEMGAKWIELTPEGQQDPLLGYLRPRFKSNQGHHDRVSVLPEDAIELARNETAPFQAFRMRQKPIYGTQFHSELDRTTVYDRIHRYYEHYPEFTDDDAEFQRMVNSFEDTPLVAELLARFVREIAAIPD